MGCMNVEIKFLYIKRMHYEIGADSYKDLLLIPILTNSKFLLKVYANYLILCIQLSTFFITQLLLYFCHKLKQMWFRPHYFSL